MVSTLRERTAGDGHRGRPGRSSFLRIDLGKRIEVTAVNIDRVVDGRIVEHSGAANLLSALLDAGAVVRRGDA
jgi:hypothetical protein